MDHQVKPADTLSMTIASGIAFSGLSRTSIYRLIKAGALKTVKIGKRRLIETASLRKMIEGGAA
jgi:excisionase family DNA binding protein